MKKHLFLCTLITCALAGVAQAAPTIGEKDISEDSLRKVATERQQRSLDEYAAAVKRAEKQRQRSFDKVAEVTRRNNDGLKDTIKRDHLDSMLPRCEREPRQPREPGNYYVID